MTGPHDDPFLTAALDAARRGWAVLPIEAGAKKPPKIKAWQTDASTDADQITKWWSKWSGSNIGVACGLSGLVVVDIDGEKGAASLRSLQDKLGPLPPTHTVRTRRGRHLYFAAGDGEWRPRDAFRPGIDIKAGPAYIVGAGSMVDDQRYEVTSQSRSVAALPDGWRRLLQGDSGRSGPVHTIDARATIDPSGTRDTIDAIGTTGTSDPSGTRHTIDPIPPSPDGEDGVDGVTGGYGVQAVFDRCPLVARGSSHQRIFDLARRIKRRLPDRKQPPNHVVDGLRRWYLDGREHTQKTWSDLEAEFREAWVRVRPEVDRLADALAAGCQRGVPTAVAQAFPDPEDEPVRMLAALCAELQRRSGDQPFFLAQQEAADTLCVARDRVGRWLRLFQAKDWLELTTSGSYSERRANEYRWLLGAAPPVADSPAASSTGVESV